MNQDDPLAPCFRKWLAAQQSGTDLFPEDLVPEVEATTSAERASALQQLEEEIPRWKARLRPPSPASPPVLPTQSGEVPNPNKSQRFAITGYEILSEVGRGGRGIVYKAQDLELGRLVALKVMKRDLVANVLDRERFLREARAMAAFSHDHVVTIYTVCETSSDLVLVMQFLQGESLEGRLARDVRLPLDEALRIAGEIAEGLAALHQKGLIHRDIKPANIWLEGELGRVKILDLGLARATDDDARLTQSGVIVGTPAYMAPEAWGGPPDLGVTQATDQYSLAATYVELRLGCRPSSGKNWTTLVNLSDLPQSEKAALLRALNADPGLRFRSCTEFVQALQPAIGTSVELPDEPQGMYTRVDENLPAKPEHINLGRLPSLTENLDLVGRKDQIQLLDSAWSSRQPAVVIFSAPGGVGKSAIVRRWLDELQENGYPDVTQALDWSFYNQGQYEGPRQETDSTRFFKEVALPHFGLFGLHVLNEEKGNPRRLGERIARKFLEVGGVFVLDGVEPLQHPLGDENEGRLKDEGLAGLFRVIGTAPAPLPGEPKQLLIVTTRLPVGDLTGRPGVETVRLENLSEDAGADLLRNFRFLNDPDGHLDFTPLLSTPNHQQAKREEFKAAAREYGRHALALVLLASYLLRRHAGDLKQRPLSSSEIVDQESQNASYRHARRILKSYQEMFSPTSPQPLERACWQVLSLLGLFDQPVPADLLWVVCEGSPIRRLTDGLTEDLFHKAIHELRNIRLVTGGHNTKDPLDMHPLVRGHFGQALESDYLAAWRQAHGRLYKHFCDAVTEEQPDTLEKMGPLYRAVAHGCKAGRYLEVLDEVCWHRLMRGHEWYAIKRLHAYEETLTAVSHFFEDKDWGRPVSALRGPVLGGVLGFAGTLLATVGRLKHGEKALEAAFEVLMHGKWYNLLAMLQRVLPRWLQRHVLPRPLRFMAHNRVDVGGSRAAIARHLCVTSLQLGNLDQALDYAQQYMSLSDRIGLILNPDDVRHRVISRAVLGHVLHLRGELEQAAARFVEAERKQQSAEPLADLLYSLFGAWYCELLIDQGKCDEAAQRSERLKYLATLPLKGALGKIDAVFPLIISWSSRLRDSSWRPQRSQAQAIASELNAAITEIGRAEHSMLLPWPLLTRASFHRRDPDTFDLARSDLNAVSEIATRSGMKLYQADCHLEYARLHLACHRQNPDPNQVREARRKLADAKKLIDDMGYERRRFELERLGQEVG